MPSDSAASHPLKNTIRAVVSSKKINLGKLAYFQIRKTDIQQTTIATQFTTT